MATPPLPPPTLALNLQTSVDKYCAALSTPQRLLKLAPKTSGHPGNAAVLSPAVVLTTISAFEGFSEDYLATLLALQGVGLAQIAKQAGGWNNPTLQAWTDRVKQLISPPAQQALDAGPPRKIRTHRVNSSGNWSPAGRDWADVLTDSLAWMQVRHLLTHGLTTGWRFEAWPPSLKKGEPAAGDVLRPSPHTAGKRSLDRTCATSCARIYTLGALHVADIAAGDLGQTLDWSKLPTFK